ncbi:unnamed protein product [Cylicocyclus nassatus]|uniref:Uncharacterized protein n=1 Tax=Cylicocyclus nassatus TaxID=53992 RepID=A0AA36HDM3_CYLNA|nr:unnamed protein product [Cylicocyclus nassatus]
MMGLLSTIRGKKDVPVIGSPAVGPIASKSKKLVIQEWPRLLEREPNLFINVWNASAARSTSIKQAFGIADNENPEDNKAFVNLAATIQKFFYRLVCMAEAIDDTLSSYMDDEEKRPEMILAYQRVFNKVVHHMRTGYNERRREKLKSNGRTEIDYQLKHAD